jgi:hypothetical protein
MEMFNKKVLKERIGDLKKSNNLKALEPVERYLISKAKDLGIKVSYDVMAEEMPYFDTIGYTEYGTNFMLNPLNLSMRMGSIRDAEYVTSEYKILDYASYLADNIKNKLANKYKERSDDFEGYRDVSALVVLPGSNKLKGNVCLNKLKKIKELYGNDIYFKPHPITTHAMIGELKDLFGEDTILPREIDLYHFLAKVDKVYTTHISESALYAVALGKEIEPIDVYNDIRMGSFFSMNEGLFNNQVEGKQWINKVMSNPKSGIINPTLDVNWKSKVDIYLEYIMTKRNLYKDWYIDGRVPKDKQKNKND